MTTSKSSAQTLDEQMCLQYIPHGKIEAASVQKLDILHHKNKDNHDC